MSLADELREWARPEAESRGQPRLQASLPVLRRVGARYVSERTLDLSAQGLAIATKELLLPGTSVELVLASPDGSSEVPLRGRVCTLAQLASKGPDGDAPYRVGLLITRLEPALQPVFQSILLNVLLSLEGRSRGQRLELNLEVSWQGAGPRVAPLPLRLKNLGAGGALVAGAEVPQKGARGEFLLASPEEGQPVGIHSEVVWRRAADPEDCAGVVFLPGERNRELLPRVLKELLFTPARPGRPMVSSSRARVGQFELMAAIARGGMCDVFQARAVEGPLLGSKVALKRLRPELAAQPGAAERFLTEADLGRLLQHPGVARVFTALTFAGEHWIAMELIDGEPLSSVLTAYLQAGARPELSALVSVAVELLTVLEHCHGLSSLSGKALEVVHGDVTPSNVMIARDGAVKLTDFGAATTSVSELSDLPAFATKLSYLAPELYLDGPLPTPLVDVFQVGVLLYEALTGLVPFKAQTPKEMCQAVRRGPIAPSRLNSQVPPKLEKAILDALQFEPWKRHQGAHAFCDTLFATGLCPPPEQGWAARRALFRGPGPPHQR